MNDRAGSEGAGREDAGEMLAIARAADARLGDPLGLAEDRITALADRARAAGDAPRDDCPVIRPDGGHRSADALDDAGALVAEEDRESHAPAVHVLDVEIGVANTARGQADENLVVPEIIEGDRLDSDTLAGRVQHRAPIPHRKRLRPRFYRTVVWYIVPARGTPGGEVSAPTLVRRQRRSAEREKSIRAAALRIFRQKGYHAASMQNIADAVGLYKGSLYYYVSSKEELLVRLFEGRADQVLGEIRAITYGTVTCTEQLRAMVRAYVLGVLRNLDSVRVYLREEHVLPPAALRQVHAEQRTMRDLFECVIGDGMRDGSFVGTDPKLAALALLGMCTWVHRWYRPRGRLSETAIADDFAERAIRMLNV